MIVRIFQQHTHAGVTYPAGSEIDLPDDAAQYLLNAEGQRRAEIVKAQAEYDALKAAVETTKE